MPLRAVVANWPLASAIIHAKLGASPAGNAVMRTTMVPTMLGMLFDEIYIQAPRISIVETV
jgi:hypothetical protein